VGNVGKNAIQFICTVVPAY